LAASSSRLPDRIRSSRLKRLSARAAQVILSRLWASLHILFFDVSITVDLGRGKSTPAVLPSAPVLPPLIAALGDSRNWSVALPSQSADQDLPASYFWPP
jgi:hypothetical protein